jgi:hypothetical protein
MAMTKEEQKAAAARIMAKHPLTEEERQTYEMLKKRPEDYRPPDPETGERVCGICGEKFKTKAAKGEDREISALEQFSEHQRKHNASPAQWTEAHKRIEASKERQKEREKSENTGRG